MPKPKYSPEDGLLGLCEALNDGFAHEIHCTQPSCQASTGLKGYVRNAGGKRDRQGLRRRRWECRVCERTVSCSTYLALAKATLPAETFSNAVASACQVELDLDSDDAENRYLVPEPSQQAGHPQQNKDRSHHAGQSLKRKITEFLHDHTFEQLSASKLPTPLLDSSQLSDPPYTPTPGLYSKPTIATQPKPPTSSFVAPRSIAHPFATELSRTKLQEIITVTQSLLELLPSTAPGTDISFTSSTPSNCKDSPPHKRKQSTDPRPVQELHNAASTSQKSSALLNDDLNRQRIHTPATVVTPNTEEEHNTDSAQPPWTPAKQLAYRFGTASSPRGRKAIRNEAKDQGKPFFQRFNQRLKEKGTASSKLPQ